MPPSKLDSRGRALAKRGGRYSLVGLTCALLNYVIILAVDAAGGHYLIATFAAFVAVTPIGYVLHSRFTFVEPMSWKSFWRFVAGVASAYPVAILSMIVLCSGFKLGVAIATPIATGAVFLWNFAAAHWAILPRNKLRMAVFGVRSGQPRERS